MCRLTETCLQALVCCRDENALRLLAASTCPVVEGTWRRGSVYSIILDDVLIVDTHRLVYSFEGSISLSMLLLNDMHS